MSRSRAWLASLAVSAIACAPQPLIEGTALNEGPLYDIADRASQASGLRVLAPLSVELVTRQELLELLKQEEGALAPDVERASAEAAMGLRTDTGIDLELLSRVSAGVYLRSTRTLHLISERAQGRDGSIHLRSHGGLGDEVTLAHEVVHALQHQHFPHLFDPGPVWESQSDAAVALQAAIEGSATFAAANTLGFLGAPRDPDDVIADSPAGGPLEDEHPLVRERMSFPYTYGYRLAFQEGHRLLESPPVSTEQVIHLEGRGRRRAFLAIGLSRLGDAAAQRGCRVLHEDTMGELVISLWLRSFGPQIDAAVAEGWDGDRWIVLECSGRNEMAWLTHWDTPEAAAGFEQTVREIAEVLQQRAGASSRLSADRSEREVLVASGGFPIASEQILELASRARVASREELAAHFQEQEGRP